MNNDMKLSYVPATLEDGQLIANEAYELEFKGLKVMIGTSVFDGKTIVYVDGNLANVRIEVNEAEIALPTDVEPDEDEGHQRDYPLTD